jgi:hypothetical protein
VSDVRADLSRPPPRTAVVEYASAEEADLAHWVDAAKSVVVELPSGRSFDAVGRLVLAGVGSRVRLPVDRIGDLQLALEAVFQEQASRDTLTIEMVPSAEGLCVRIGPLSAVDAERSGVERVVSPFVDEVVTRVSGRNVWLELRASQRPLAHASR